MDTPLILGILSLITSTGTILTGLALYRKSAGEAAKLRAETEKLLADAKKARHDARQSETGETIDDAQAAQGFAEAVGKWSEQYGLVQDMLTELSEKYDKLEADYTILSESNHVLQLKYESAQQTIRTLTADNAELRRRVEELTSRMDNGDTGCNDQKPVARAAKT